MAITLASTGARFRRRVEDKCARNGLAYPWWIPTASSLAQVTCAIVALFERDAFTPPGFAILAAVLIAAPHVAQFVFTAWIPTWVNYVLGISGATWLLAVNPQVRPEYDTATAILPFLAAEAAATDRPRMAAGVGGLSIAVLVVAVSDGNSLAGLYVVEVLVGLMVGCMLRWLSRALTAERAARSGEHTRATMAERQRIAREIHDLVGHSLSVTLLHVTGARRALTEDKDVDDAAEALIEAERIGRQAMAEIRRTVAVLADESAGAQPLPTATDIDRLVTDVRSAGLKLSFAATGDPAALPASTGLGVYRVAQESLANVAKHAPTSPTTVSLDVDRQRVRLLVHNRLRRAPSVNGSGRGLPGMAARAEQLGGSLTAGPSEDGWRVEMIVPVPAAEGDDCFIRRTLR